MEAIIKSLNPEELDTIDEVFGDNWRLDTSAFYEDGVKVCDVVVNLKNVTIETDEDEDGVWICRSCDAMYKLDTFNFLEIVIR